MDVAREIFFFLWSHDHNLWWSTMILSTQLCVKRIKINKPSYYRTVACRNTHTHTRLITASISFLIHFQSFTSNTPKLMRMPGRLRWSGNGCVPCHAPLCYIIHPHSACGGALRGWNINTNEVAGLTTQTQHLYRAWILICTTTNTCLTRPLWARRECWAC